MKGRQEIETNQAINRTKSYDVSFFMEKLPRGKYLFVVKKKCIKWGDRYLSTLDEAQCKFHEGGTY